MSKELKWLESKGVKNIILGISCDKGVVELSVLLKAYADKCVEKREKEIQKKVFDDLAAAFKQLDHE